MTLPTAGAIALFGESRPTLWLTPIFYGAIGLFAFTAIVGRRFGPMAAGIAAFVLVATPTFGGQLLALNVGIVEFGWVMAALFCLDRATIGGDRRWGVAAGLLLGLAMLSRTTTAVLMPILAVALWAGGQRRLLPAMIGGWLVLLMLEAGGYWLATGNPAHSWSLAMGHSKLPTTALPPGVDLTRSPLFNPEFISNWHRAMGIHVHWTIDGLLNLLFDPTIGPTLLAALALVMLHRRDIAPGGMVGAAPLWLLLAGATYFGGLAYALAVDPQPRMFLPVAACGAAIIGVLGARSWLAGGRLLIAAVLAMLAINAVTVAFARSFDLSRIERTASAWTAEAPDRMAMDETARRVLTLAPAIRSLPSHPAKGRDRMMLITRNRCPADIRAANGVAWPRARQALFPDSHQRDAYRLCEFRAA
nr:glycosyltransferase family 39 protein [Sphingomonas laterariae]